MLGHAREQLDRLDVHAVAGVGVRRGKEEQMARRVEAHQRIAVCAQHLDHVGGQQRPVGAAKAAAGERRIQHVPVGCVAQAEAQVLDHGAGAGTAERARVQHVVIAPGTAVARGVLERVRHGGAQVAGLGGAAVAGQDVVAIAAGDAVVARPAQDEVVARATTDDVVAGAAEQAVVAVPAQDLEVRDQRPLLEVARVDAPLAVDPLELEFRVGVELVVACTQIDHRALDADGLVEQVLLLVHPGSTCGPLRQQRHQGGARRGCGVRDAEAELGGRIGGTDRDLQRLARTRCHGGEGQAFAVVACTHQALQRRAGGIDDGVQVGHQVQQRDVVAGSVVTGEGQHEAAVDFARRALVQRQAEVRLGFQRGAGQVAQCHQRGGHGAGTLEFLVGDVPHLVGELVAVQEAVPADGGKVRHVAAGPVGVAAQEQHAVIARAAVEALVVGRHEGVGRGLLEGRHEGVLVALEQRQVVRDDLEGVVARFTKQQVRGLAVQAAGQHVIARPAEDPVLAGATGQDVVARATQDHVAAHRVAAGAEVHDHGGVVRGRVDQTVLQVEHQVVDGGDEIRAVDAQQVVGVGLQARQRDLRHRGAAQVQHVDHRRADVGEQVVPARAGGSRRVVQVFEPNARKVGAGAEPVERHLGAAVCADRDVLHRDRAHRVQGLVQDVQAEHIARVGDDLQQAEEIIGRALGSQLEAEPVLVQRIVDGQAAQARQTIDARDLVGGGGAVIAPRHEVGGVAVAAQRPQGAVGLALVDGQAEAIDGRGAVQADQGRSAGVGQQLEGEEVGVRRVVDGEVGVGQGACDAQVGVGLQAVQQAELRGRGVAPSHVERQREADARLQAAGHAGGVGHFPRGQGDPVALAAGDDMLTGPGPGQGDIEVGHQVVDADVVCRGEADAGRGPGRHDGGELAAIGQLHREVRIVGQLAIGRRSKRPHHHRSAAQGEGLGGRVVARAVLGLVHQDGVAGEDLDAVVARTGVDPDRLLHRGADCDLVVAAQGVDDDGEEVTFRRQQVAHQLACCAVERDLIDLDAIGGLGAQRRDPQQDVVGRPDVVALAVAAVEVQAHLCIERIVAVVVGQARDQVVVGQQAGFGDVVDADHVVGIGRADVPHLVGLPGVLLPVVAAETAIERLEGRAIDPDQGIVAAVAVQEPQPGAAVQHIVLGRTEHAVQAGVFQVVGDVGGGVVIETVAVAVAVGRRQAAIRALEDAELARVERDRRERGASRAGRGTEDEPPVLQVGAHPVREIDGGARRIGGHGQCRVEVCHQIAQALFVDAGDQTGVDGVGVVVGRCSAQIDVVGQAIQCQREAGVAVDAPVGPARGTAGQQQVCTEAAVGDQLARAGGRRGGHDAQVVDAEGGDRAVGPAQPQFRGGGGGGEDEVQPA